MSTRHEKSEEIVGNPTDNPAGASRGKGKLSGDLARRVREAIFYALRHLPEDPSRAQVEEVVSQRFRDVYAEWVVVVPVPTTRLDYIGRVLKEELGDVRLAAIPAARTIASSMPRSMRGVRNGAASPLSADLTLIGPADRLQMVAGSRSEPSVFEPGRRPWAYLFNRGGAIATEIELFMGPSGHVDSVSAIRPGEAAELRWPGPSYHPIPANPHAKGGIVHLKVTYRTNAEPRLLAGNLQLDDDGVPVLLTENPNGPQQRTTRIR